MSIDKLRSYLAILNDPHVIAALRTDHQSLYWEPCTAYLQSFLGNRFPSLPQEMREDVAQEAALLIHQNLATFRGDSAFTTWAAKVTFHFMIDVLRKQKGKKTWEVQSSDDSDEIKDVLHLIQAEADPEELVLSRERFREFGEACAEFLQTRRKSARDREILHKLAQGYSYQEIAEEHYIQPTVVSSVLYAFRRFWYKKHPEDKPQKPHQRSQ